MEKLKLLFYSMPVIMILFVCSLGRAQEQIPSKQEQDTEKTVKYAVTNEEDQSAKSGHKWYFRTGWVYWDVKHNFRLTSSNSFKQKGSLTGGYSSLSLGRWSLMFTQIEGATRDWQSGGSKPGVPAKTYLNENSRATTDYSGVKANVHKKDQVVSAAYYLGSFICDRLKLSLLGTFRSTNMTGSIDYYDIAVARDEIKQVNPRSIKSSWDVKYHWYGPGLGLGWNVPLPYHFDYNGNFVGELLYVNGESGGKTGSFVDQKFSRSQGWGITAATGLSWNYKVTNWLTVDIGAGVRIQYQHLQQIITESYIGPFGRAGMLISF
jgi:hypothetical protein